MPCLSIQLDGANVATIKFAEMDVGSVSVHGSLDQDPKATLDASGGNCAEGGCGSLTWVDELPLQPGQVVSVKFTETCDIGDRGRTIQELFPDYEPSTQTDFTLTEAMVAELRTRPRLHESFAVHAETSSGQQATAVSNERNTDFTFSVTWDFTRHTQARVHLSTHCLDDVVERKAGTKHLEEKMSFGDEASFTLLP